MKLRQMFNKLSKKTRAVLAGVGVAAAIALPIMAKAEWYPVRPIFDYNKMPINGSTCTDADKTAGNRCGSMTGPVFNSFINTPSYGDERAFFDGRRSDMPTNTNADQINDVTNGSREVVLRTYVHNNANQNTNASGLGVAKNAKVRVLLPTATSQVLRARSYISADNATMVEDTTDMVGSKQFSVSYVPGSAKLLRGTAQYSLSDSVVTTGASIGDKTMNGSLPGCFDYAALVEIRVRVNVATSDLNIAKKVRKHVDGQTGNWSKEISVPAGTKVDYLIDTSNGGTATLKDVTTRDLLPPHTALVPGTVKYTNARGSATQADGPLFGGGIIGGQYNPNDNSLITFSAITKDDFQGCSVKVRNVAYAKSSTTPEINDTADVTITKENCNPNPPVYSCDSLTAFSLGDKKYKFTATYTAKDGATLKSLNFVFGDGKNTSGTSTTAEHTYTKDGKYSARVEATFSVNGQDKVVTGPACTVTVDINTPPTPEYSCDMLTATKVGSRSYEFKVATTAKNGAVVKMYTYDYGDKSDKFVTDKNPVQHTYAKDGNYVARVAVMFTVNGKDKVVDSDKCAVSVSITTPPVVPPTTPPTTPELPKTGAGDVAGIFTGVSAFGAGLHQLVTRRRNRKS